jgi:hypothetical protein
MDRNSANLRKKMGLFCSREIFRLHQEHKITTKCMGYSLHGLF